MSTNNGRITAPVTTTDVGNTLQSSSRDVGTLCTNKNINKWARHKPVRYATVTGITDEQLKSVGFGLQVPTYVTNWETALTQTYTYLPPRGGADEPYRLGDFRDYSHNVPAPCSKSPDITVATWELSYVPVTLNVQYLGGDAYNIGLFELNPDLKDWYLACILQYTTNGSDTVSVYKTAENPIGQIAYQVVFSDELRYGMRNIHYYFLLTDTKQSTATSAINGHKFINLPFDNLTDNDGRIYIDTRNLIKANTLGATTDPTGDSYIATNDASYDGGLVWWATSNGAIFLQVELTCETSITMLDTHIRGKVEPTFNRDKWMQNGNTFTGTTGYVYMDMIYHLGDDGTWTKVDKIILTAGVTETYRIGSTHWLACYDGVEAYYTQSGRYWPGSVTITYDPGTVNYTLGGAAPINIGVQ